MKGLVTGGTRGIGRAIVEAVVPRLTELTIVARDPGRLEDVRAEISRLNKSCAVDVISADQADVRAFGAALRDWRDRAGSTRVLDFVVLNAGTYTEGDLATIDIDDFRRDMDINLNVNVVAVQELLPCLRLGVRRRVFVIGSTAAYEPYPLVPSYGVAKWGLRSYAANLRVELRRERIGVSFIAPGGTLTDMWEGEDLPPGRLLEPSDLGVLVNACLSLSEQAVVEQLVVVPMDGDIHE